MVHVMKIEYGTTNLFEKDFSKMLKRFKTLAADLEVAKRNAIELFHLQKINNQSIFPIPKFCSSEIQICKLKKFACKALKGRGVQSGIRMIYAYHMKIFRVNFIEMYFKADQENENQQRIVEYLKNI